VVLEGLDRTGKSTQAAALRRALDPDGTVHVHLPRGLTPFTSELYSMLESTTRGPESGLSRQLAHLSCHAETVPAVLDALETRAVVLDRWWWSTVAYGWFSGDVAESGVGLDAFMALINGIWGYVSPSVVLVFDEPFEPDSNNAPWVVDGYRQLLMDNPLLAVRVPRRDPQAVTRLILDELDRRGLLADVD